MKQLHQRGGYMHDRRSKSFKAHGGVSDIYQAILKGEEFESGHLHSQRIMSRYDLVHRSGKLPENAIWMWEHDWEAIDYVVFSYATPIAWHVDQAIRDKDPSVVTYWVVPDVRYSHTTTKHQGIVRTALNMMGIVYDE